MSPWVAALVGGAIGILIGAQLQDVVHREERRELRELLDWEREVRAFLHQCMAGWQGSPMARIAQRLLRDEAGA